MMRSIERIMTLSSIVRCGFVAGAPQAEDLRLRYAATLGNYILAAPWLSWRSVIAGVPHHSDWYAPDGALHSRVGVVATNRCLLRRPSCRIHGAIRRIYGAIAATLPCSTVQPCTS